jgi:hypothetical protein
MAGGSGGACTAERTLKLRWYCLQNMQQQLGSQAMAREQLEALCTPMLNHHILLQILFGHTRSAECMLVAASITQTASPTCPAASHQHTKLPDKDLLLTVIIVIRPRVSLLLSLPGGHHDASSGEVGSALHAPTPVTIYYPNY